MKAIMRLGTVQCVLMVMNFLRMPGIYRAYVQLGQRQKRQTTKELALQSVYSGYHRDTGFNSENYDEDQAAHESIMNKKCGLQVGANYYLQTKIPVIGVQTFQLRILREDVAELEINGVLEIKDTIQYKVDQESGELFFAISEKTNMILKKFRTKLLKATYCPKRDRPSILVRPPLPMNLSLHLMRQF
mmetsp:Transcript_4501/g.8658  ORF Transcript_4501/g.8658 Transcript_4501/m.8658 type:complete len:188 (-) Transcript_4501:121-684(-)